MKKKIIAVISMIGFLMCILGIRKEKPISIHINEVMAENGSYIPDEDGEYVDWIELYNPGDESVSLKGFGLSDQKELPDLWVFPEVSIGPGEYLIVYASGKNRTNPKEELHTNFKINASGEALFLSDSKGTLIHGITVNKTAFDKSYGYISDKNELSALSCATPGELNTSVADFKVKATEDIHFSLPAGRYEEDVFLELSCSENNAELYYTMDGSIPTKDSAQYTGGEIFVYNRTEEENRYTGIWCTPADFAKDEEYTYDPAAQYKATVVKVRMYFPEEDCWSEDVWTNTYLIEENYTMPVVSLSVSEELLFDEETGIYVPGLAYEKYVNSTKELSKDLRLWKGNYSDDRKVFGSLEYFVDGTRVMKNDVTLRICGAASRGNGQKSFSVYAWNNETEPFFSYPFFGENYKDLQGETIKEFSSIRLRAFGNDRGRSMFRDALSQALVEDLDLGTQAYQPCILLINGEYFGVYEIRENRDKCFFEQHFGIPEDEIVKLELFNLNEENADFHGKELLELLEFVKRNDLYLSVNYEYVKSKIDIEQFVDYIITEQYLYNLDWPMNNVVVFRSATAKEDSKYQDGRWRFVLYDMDYAINYQTEDNFVTVKNGDSYVSVLLSALLDNYEFCDLYTRRFEELLENNFEASRALAIQEEFQSEFAPEIEDTLKRWNIYNSDTNVLKETTVDYWYEKMEDLRSFFIERPECAREYFYKEIKTK